MIRVVIVIALSATASALAQACFRFGMEQVGELDMFALPHMIRFFGRALRNPFVVGGTALAGVSYFLYLSALSWRDLTIVFPISSMDYALVSVLAVVVLKEQVPPARWLGIVLIGCGIIVISLSAGKKV